jgi:prepilin-type N-terminal cleavage/methylation domain-containing protein
MKTKNGFSLIELLVVIGIASVLLALGATLSSKFAARHSTDNVTRTISSTLQLTRLKAAREGLEYRAVFSNCSNLGSYTCGNFTCGGTLNGQTCLACSAYTEYKPSDNKLYIRVERGNSNRNSCCWCQESSQAINIKQSINLDLSALPKNPYHHTFNPKGTLDSSTTDTTIFINPSSNIDGLRCGKVMVSALGRISIVEGTWNSSQSTCNAVH